MNVSAESCRALRRTVVTMLHESGTGHVGGSMSCIEIMNALYGGVMRVDPANPHDPKRDRFVLSKGHAAPVLYAVLAEMGFFPKEELMTLRKMGSHRFCKTHLLSGIMAAGWSISQRLQSA